jgi:hypothetical protein
MPRNAETDALDAHQIAAATLPLPVVKLRRPQLNDGIRQALCRPGPVRGYREAPFAAEALGRVMLAGRGWCCRTRGSSCGKGIQWWSPGCPSAAS